MNPGIAASSGGEVRVAWQDSRNGPFRWNTFVRASHDGGVTWDRAVDVSDVNGGYGYLHPRGYDADYGDYMQVAITSTGETFAVWGAGFGYAGPGGTWFNVEGSTTCGLTRGKGDGPCAPNLKGCTTRSRRCLPRRDPTWAPGSRRIRIRRSGTTSTCPRHAAPGGWSGSWRSSRRSACWPAPSSRPLVHAWEAGRRVPRVLVHGDAQRRARPLEPVRADPLRGQPGRRARRLPAGRPGRRAPHLERDGDRVLVRRPDGRGPLARSRRRTSPIATAIAGRRCSSGGSIRGRADFDFDPGGREAAGVAGPLYPHPGPSTIYVSGVVAINVADPNPPGFDYAGVAGSGRAARAGARAGARALQGARRADGAVGRRHDRLRSRRPGGSARAGELRRLPHHAPGPLIRGRPACVRRPRAGRLLHLQMICTRELGTVAAMIPDRICCSC